MVSEAHTSENRRVRAFFDTHASEWDSMMPPESAQRAREILETIPIAPGGRILDAGCGTGVLFPALARRVSSQGLLLATDVAFQMLRAARLRPVSMPISLFQGDTHDLPLAAGSLDMVVCHNVFPHFLDPAGTLREIARVLVSGGRAVVCHSKSRDAINDHHRNVGDAVGGHFLPDDTAMKRLFEAAGLGVSRFESLDDRYVVVGEKR